MLSQSTIHIIRKITPLVAANAEKITCRFYELMFQRNPEVKAFFNPAHQREGTQSKALAEAVCAYFANIENLEVLGPAIEVLAQKHCALQVQPEHYPIVGQHLLAAIKEVMGDAVTDEIAAAVGEAYQFLADICIQREKEIYASQIAAEGGWNGYRKFVVDRKVPESDIVTSLYLRPQDGGQLPKFQPGQYITLRVDNPATPTTPRNYSLSHRPGLDYFRISVKKETSKNAQVPGGVVSTFLHEQVSSGDLIDVGPPCGEFTVDVDSVNERPVVFLAGGVGVTPLLSMAKTLVHYGVLAPIYFLHAVRNSSVQPFVDEIQQMVSDKDFVETRFIYDSPSQQDIETRKCDHVGTINKELIQKWTPWESAEFYICGPRPFMRDAIAALEQLGIEESRIRFEFFGPKQLLKAEAVA